MTTKSSSSCEKIKSEIEVAQELLDQWQRNLLNLRKVNPPKFEDIRTARETVEDCKTELLRLKTQQQSMDCLPEESSILFQDNQSILQTSSVRKKDSRALEDERKPDKQKGK
jgi:Tfp pilus assembly protein PilN